MSFEFKFIINKNNFFKYLILSDSFLNIFVYRQDLEFLKFKII